MDDILKENSEEQSTGDINTAINLLQLDDTNQTIQTDDASTNYFNRRFLDKNATTYELEKFTKNKMLIFHQKSYRHTLREGTEKDVDALISCFEELNFEVECFHDCTRDEIFDILGKAINQDLSDYGCFAVVMLMHGSRNGQLLTKNFPIYEYQIVEALKGSNAPSLSTKPKILIIQACRGEGESHAVPVGQMPYDVPYQNYIYHLSGNNYTYTVAEESDYLIIHSTSPDMVSYRDKKYGTWFIQSLCKSISESEPHEDILDVLTRVQRDVSINYEALSRWAIKNGMGMGKQTPMTTSTLMRQLYLKSGTNVAKKQTDHSTEPTPFTTPPKNARKLENIEQSEEVEAKTNEHTSNSKEKRREREKKGHKKTRARNINIPTKYFNSRFLDENATTYELEKFTKNKMLIFNQETFREKDRRAGTDKDVAALKECFKKRAFEVECFKDCKRDELFENLEDVICEDLSDYGCFVVVILTHGSYDGQLMTMNYPFYEREIVEFLKGSNAPGLLTKPKILIIQACRGDDVSRAAPVGQKSHGTFDQHGSQGIKNYAYTIPEESDFLIIHSTYPGMKANRSQKYGTWFIQSLCKMINESEPYEDVSLILTRIARHVSINNAKSCFEAEEKQMPTMTTTLIRTLYFNSGITAAKKHQEHRVETVPFTTPTKNARKPVEQPEKVETSSSEDEEDEETEST